MKLIEISSLRSRNYKKMKNKKITTKFTKGMKICNTSCEYARGNTFEDNTFCLKLILSRQHCPQKC